MSASLSVLLDGARASDATTPPAAAVPSADPRARLVLGSLGLALAGAMLFSVGVGAVAIEPTQVIAILAASVGLETPWAYEAQQALVLTGIRLPRVLLGALVGAALSVSGALMQGLFRNPLADPSLIGVSSGAALGAATMIVLGGTLLGGVLLGALGIAVAAFGGGLVVTVIVYRIATRGRRTSVATMLLAGIALNALCGAGTGALVLLSNDGQLRDLTFWTLGSLGGATWGTLAVVAPLAGIALAATPRLARALNALLLGESEARHLGINTERVKRTVIALSALAVGAVTAVSGLIGFVGLVVPHLIRLAFGPDHRLLLPASALLGATLLVATDLFARILIAPAEIPIGILTALGGAPFFLALLLRGQRRSAL
ncbi:MAG: iron ABC transporter permease [Bacteroidota bacterium]